MLNKFLQFILLTSLINVTTYGSNNIYNQVNNDINNRNNSVVNTISNTNIDLSGKVNNNKQHNVDNDMSIDIDIDINNNNIEQNTNDINYRIDLSKKIRSKKLNRHKNKKIIEKNSNLNDNLNKAVNLKYIRDIQNIWENTLQYSDFNETKKRVASKKALDKIILHNKENNILNTIDKKAVFNNQTLVNVTNSTPMKRAASKKALDIITAYCHNNNLFYTNINNHVNKNSENKIGNRGKLKKNNTKKKHKLTEEERAKRDGYYSIFEDFVAMGIDPNNDAPKLPYHNVYKKLWNIKNNNNIKNDGENSEHDIVILIDNNGIDGNQGNNKQLKLKAPIFVNEDSIQNNQTNNNNQIDNTNPFSNSNILRNNYFSPIKHNYNDNQHKLLNNNENNNTVLTPIITPMKKISNIVPYNNNYSDYFNEKSNNIINYSGVEGQNLYLDFNNCDNKALTTFETPQKNIQELNNFKSLLNNSSVVLNDRHYNFKVNQEKLYSDNNNSFNNNVDNNNLENNSNNTNVKKNLLSELNNVADTNLVQNNLSQNNNNYTKKKSENNYVHFLINTVTRLLEEDPKLKDEIMTPEFKNNTIKNDSTNYQTNINYNNNKLHKNDVNNSSIKKDLYNDFSFERNDNVNKNAENIANYDYLNEK